jgi:hypothetical protein
MQSTRPTKRVWWTDLHLSSVRCFEHANTHAQQSYTSSTFLNTFIRCFRVHSAIKGYIGARCSTSPHSSYIFVVFFWHMRFCSLLPTTHRCQVLFLVLVICLLAYKRRRYREKQIGACVYKVNHPKGGLSEHDDRRHSRFDCAHYCSM